MGAPRSNGQHKWIAALVYGVTFLILISEPVSVAGGLAAALCAVIVGIVRSGKIKADESIIELAEPIGCALVALSLAALFQHLIKMPSIALDLVGGILIVSAAVAKRLGHVVWKALLFAALVSLAAGLVMLVRRYLGI